MESIPLSRSGRSAMEVAKEAALEAGELVLRRFRTNIQVAQKGRGDFVTEVDHESEKLILGRLLEEFPDFGVLAEESGGREGASEFSWIVDPVDGTRNYAIGVPIFAVTLALTRGPEVLLGVTVDPNRDDLFTAEKGAGAFANGVQMRPSSRPSLEEAVIGTDMGYSDVMGGYVLKLLDRLWPCNSGIRIMGSGALGLAYAASGRTDMFFHHLLSPWDMAAGVLMGQEAGAVVSNRSGEPLDLLNDRSIILANFGVHADFLQRTEGLQWRDS